MRVLSFNNPYKPLPMQNNDFYRGSHVISDQEPRKVVEQVSEFVKDKTNAEKVYNTTPVMAGIVQGQANLVVITSCLVMWDTTIGEFRSWQNKVQLNGGNINF